MTITETGERYLKPGVQALLDKHHLALVVPTGTGKPWSPPVGFCYHQNDMATGLEGHNRYYDVAASSLRKHLAMR